MMESYRKPLGAMLQRSILPGDQPDFGLPGVPMPNVPAKKPGLFAQGSKGQMIAGIIGDTLASLSGGEPIFTANLMRQRQMDQQREAEEAQWSRRRQAENADWQAREAWKRANPEQPSMIRNADAWGTMTDAQKAAYRDMQSAERGDPFVTTSLPNGQFYAGPQSGLIGALTGATATPTAPVGKLRPIAGGPTQPASGPFRP